MATTRRDGDDDQSSNPDGDDSLDSLPESDLGGDVGDMMRRLEKTREVRRSVELEHAREREALRRRTRCVDMTDVASPEVTLGLAYAMSRDRIFKVREKRMELEARMDSVLGNPEQQEEIVMAVGDFVQNMGPECRTAEEFMEMQRVLEISGRVIEDALKKALSKYGRLDPADVVDAFAADPAAALDRVAEAVAAFDVDAGVMPAIAGRHLLGPYSLNFEQGQGGVKPERARAKRREKEDMPTVVPTKDAGGENPLTDPTSLGVMTMHRRLQELKKISLFELVVDPDDNFKQTALNTHVLAILLDRQLARIVAARPNGSDPKDSVQVYYVAAKAGADNVQAAEKLAEDREKGHTWITRWDHVLTRLVRNEVDGSGDLSGLGIEFDVDGDETAAASGSSPVQKTPRLC